MAKRPAKMAKKAHKTGRSLRKPKFKARAKTLKPKNKAKGAGVKRSSPMKKKIASRVRMRRPSVIQAPIKRPKPIPIETKSLPPMEKPTSKPRGKYKFLDHTADIMVLASGPDFKDALAQAGLAMFSVLGRAKAVDSFEIEETARSRTDLVVYVLARILSECDVHEMVPARMDITEYDEHAHRLKAQVWGERIRPKDAIKAVTYHLLEVREEKGQCYIQVVFDV